jgi:methylphosphotriester-DNA--protein-cysteine methyltransferase
MLGTQLDHRPTLVQLGALLGRSPWHLNVTVQQQTGLTIHELATAIRMTEAAFAILAGEKVEAVALSLGYRSAKSFYRQFERFFGTTPTNFRKSTHRAAGDSSGPDRAADNESAAASGRPRSNHARYRNRTRHGSISPDK